MSDFVWSCGRVFRRLEAYLCHLRTWHGSRLRKLELNRLFGRFRP